MGYNILFREVAKIPSLRRRLMILVVTTSYTGTADDLVNVFSQREIDFFRFNTDLYADYSFIWDHKNFKIVDPLGRCCKSEEITLCIMYKCILWPSPMQFSDSTLKNPQYVSYILNELCGCIANWAIANRKLRLWHPTEYAFPKTKQMDVAKKIFSVPTFVIHWGCQLTSKEVIAKQLVQRPLDNGKLPYAGMVDRSLLDPKYPWLTQDIADGNRDATVLYINGKVHCYQFATVRGDLTDWRITQGTDANQWVTWNAGNVFEHKVDSYMKEMGLKFGRLDFIIGGKEPQFLEVNARGQFGWLDDKNLTLHNEVVDAILDPSSTITL